eukprot:1391308-Prymnesium_polylepis.1
MRKRKLARIFRALTALFSHPGAGPENKTFDFVNRIKSERYYLTPTSRAPGRAHARKSRRRPRDGQRAA